MTVWLDFNADDYGTTDYKAVLAQRQLALVGALLAPALSTAGSVRAMFLMPRDPYRIIASSLVLLLAGAMMWFCCSVGFSAIDHANRTVMRQG
jgi:hypothetical protein